MPGQYYNTLQFKLRAVVNAVSEELTKWETNVGYDVKTVMEIIKTQSEYDEDVVCYTGHI